MPEDYLRRRPPYNYYGRQNGYPQYRGLTSGINMLGDDAVSAGWESMINSMQEIQSIEYQDEQQRQEKFKSLIDVSLKDVRGAWRDEAVKKKEAFLGDATKIASESQGKLTWEQEKQLMGKKESLEQFAGKSKEVEDWYAKAFQTASMIKDQEAKKATLANITDIMDTKQGLDKTYERTLNPNWLVQPEYKFTDAIKLIPEKRNPNTGLPDVDAMAKSTIAFLEAGDPTITKFYTDALEDDKTLTPEKWAKRFAETKSFGMDKKPLSTYQDKQVDPYTKRKRPPPAITANTEGEYIYGGLNKGKGIYLGSVTVDGKTYSGASVQSEFYDPETGERKYKVTYTIPDESVKEQKEKQRKESIEKIKRRNPDKNYTDEQAWENGGKDRYTKWVSENYYKFIKDGKEPVIMGVTTVPVGKYKSTVDRVITTKRKIYKTKTGEEFTEEELVKFYKGKNPEKTISEILKIIRNGKFSEI